MFIEWRFNKNKTQLQQIGPSMRLAYCFHFCGSVLASMVIPMANRTRKKIWSHWKWQIELLYIDVWKRVYSLLIRQPSSHCREQNVFVTSHITQSLENSYYLTCWQLLGKASLAVLVFIWSGSEYFQVESSIPRVFVKNNHQQLFNTGAVWNSDIIWNK